MKLSACLIVKNEEENIERCLRSIGDHVDEIIIIDTGSTDSTREVIRSTWDSFSAECSLWEFPWNGSFADMRNKSMDLATGDVLFIIDADEYLVRGAEYIRQAIQHPDFVCGSVHVLNQVGHGSIQGERIFQPRLFLNKPEIRYKYKIHNQIDHAVAEYGAKFKEEHGRPAALIGIDAEIVHTGYNLGVEGAQEKYAKRIQMCREAITESVKEKQVRDENYYKFQLALFLTIVDNSEETLPLWEEIDYTYLNRFNKWYAHYIASRTYLSMERYDDALIHCSGMFEAMHGKMDDGPIAEEAASWWVAGAVLLEMGERDWGVIFLIDAFLKNLRPAWNARCILNVQVMIDDIRRQFEEGDWRRKMLKTKNMQVLVENLRRLQRELFGFDETLVECVNEEYV